MRFGLPGLAVLRGWCSLGVTQACFGPEWACEVPSFGGVAGLWGRAGRIHLPQW